MEKQLIEQLLNGERSAVAKAISYVENEQADARTLVKKIFKKTGNAHRIGITGPPGAGKSSLINETVYPALSKELNNARAYPLSRFAFGFSNSNLP